MEDCGSLLTKPIQYYKRMWDDDEIRHYPLNCVIYFIGGIFDSNVSALTHSKGTLKLKTLYERHTVRSIRLAFDDCKTLYFSFQLILNMKLD